MRKLLSLIMAGLLLTSLAACDDSGDTTNTGTATNTGYTKTADPATTDMGMNTDNMGDYLANNHTNTSFQTDGMGTDYQPIGNALNDHTAYPDSDYQHSGVTGANSITADM